jgi:hypothetical protein
MNPIIELLKDHYGKISSATLAVLLGAWLLYSGRGCDLDLHVRPAAARTNTAPADVTTNTP